MGGVFAGRFGELCEGFMGSVSAGGFGELCEGFMGGVFAGRFGELCEGFRSPADVRLAPDPGLSGRTVVVGHCLDLWSQQRPVEFIV